jgi:hypothetical protein
MDIHLKHAEPIGSSFIDNYGRTLHALACPLYCLH